MLVVEHVALHPGEQPGPGRRTVEGRPTVEGCTTRAEAAWGDGEPVRVHVAGSLRGVLASGLRMGGTSYEDLLANGQAVIGSPSSVAKRLSELYDELGGFGHIIGLFAIGPSTHEQVMRSSELFATRSRGNICHTRAP